MAELLHTPVEIVDRHDALDLAQVVRDAPPEARDVRFDQVSFSYAAAGGAAPNPKPNPNSNSNSNPNPSQVSFSYAAAGGAAHGVGVRGLSLRIPPGGRLGLVGPSGSGKSTVTRLLTRLFEAERGSVRVCGCDVRHVTQRSLRTVTSAPQPQPSPRPQPQPQPSPRPQPQPQP